MVTVLYRCRHYLKCYISIILPIILVGRYLNIISCYTNGPRLPKKQITLFTSSLR